MERWEAGEIGCGQLVFELSLRMKRMRPGERLKVVAGSPGAPIDLPAWCRMTGHRLVSAEPPVYVLERKPDRDAGASPGSHGPGPKMPGNGSGSPSKVTRPGPPEQPL